MAQNNLTLERKKEFAKILYCDHQLTQKATAAKVGIPPKTMCAWVEKFGWDKLRKRLLITKDRQLMLLYDQVDQLNSAIQARDQKYANAKEADVLIKLTSAIRNLETDLGIAEIVESGTQFIKHIQKEITPERAIEIADYWHSFIQSKI